MTSDDSTRSVRRLVVVAAAAAPTTTTTVLLVGGLPPPRFQSRPSSSTFCALQSNRRAGRFLLRHLLGAGAAHTLTLVLLLVVSIELLFGRTQLPLLRRGGGLVVLARVPVLGVVLEPEGFDLGSEVLEHRIVQWHAELVALLLDKCLDVRHDHHLRLADVAVLLREWSPRVEAVQEGIEHLASSLVSPAELAARRSVVLNLHFIIITRAASSSASGGGRWGSGIATWRHARWERLRHLLPTKGGLGLCRPHNLAERRMHHRANFWLVFCRCPSVKGQTKNHRNTIW